MNRRIAQLLSETADLLEKAGANAFRVQAYREAAVRLAREPRAVPEILRENGLTGVEQAIGVGERMAGAIAQIAMDGYLPLLDRLRRTAKPDSVLASVPGIGRVWAERLERDFHIASLEDLETAAFDGRLQHAGLGAKRIAGIRDALSARLARARPERDLLGKVDEPSVEDLLDIDREYRAAAAAGKLRLIAPHRFNPRHEAWLPILHTTRGGRKYTALFSNTARAHQFGATHDWVVIYEESHHATRPWTVITSHRGPFAGQRVVRGRESEMSSHMHAA